MKRTIEELIEKRKDKQNQLKQSLEDLGTLLEGRGVLKNKKSQIKNNLLEINRNINELMTIQDREWDAYSNNHSTHIFESLHWKLNKLEAEYANVKTILLNFISLEKSLQHLIDSLDSKSESITKKRLGEVKEQISVFQYADFEQRFRGDEKEIEAKLKKYLPLFADFDHILDIGCGRGEFIGLLQGEGKTVEGIDISDSMLKKAAEKGIDNCQNIPALKYLKGKKDNSLGGIFSSQVIEHFHPQYLRDVAIETFRVLKPGSPIVLETINPMSIFALANIYFMDVNHQKPLHPEYMRYLLESSGFSDVDIIYRDDIKTEKLENISPENPNARIFNTNVDKLNQLLYSAPEYAVIGYKK